MSKQTEPVSEAASYRVDVNLGSSPRALFAPGSYRVDYNIFCGPTYNGFAGSGTEPICKMDTPEELPDALNQWMQRIINKLDDSVQFRFRNGTGLKITVHPGQILPPLPGGMSRDGFADAVADARERYPDVNISVVDSFDA